jgi:AraC family transcriptional regulator
MSQTDVESTREKAREEQRLSEATAEWRRRNGAALFPSSDGLGWKSMHIAGRHWRPFEFGTVPAVKDTLIGMYLDSHMVLDRRIESARWTQRNPQKNALQLIPPNAFADMRLHTPGDSIQIYLNADVVQQTAQGLTRGDPARLEFRPLFGEMDPALTQLILVARSAMTLPASVSIPHADAVASALVTHLIQYHSNATIDVPSLVTSALGRPQVEAVFCHIHSHLHEPMSLVELACIAGLSVAQLVRQFKCATGMAPHQYIMRARVERAKSMLEHDHESIADISIDCGFDSQSSLTRVFKRFFKTTPHAYRVAHSRRFFCTGFRNLV